MNPQKKIRITVAVLALAITLTLGLMAPDPRMRTSYNLVIGFFCLSAAVSFTTLIALMPTPPDPRNLLRKRRDDVSDDDASPTATTPHNFTGYSHPILTRPVPDASDSNIDEQSR